MITVLDFRLKAHSHRTSTCGMMRTVERLFSVAGLIEIRRRNRSSDRISGGGKGGEGGMRPGRQCAGAEFGGAKI